MRQPHKMAKHTQTIRWQQWNMVEQNLLIPFMWKLCIAYQIHTNSFLGSINIVNGCCFQEDMAV